MSKMTNSFGDGWRNLYLLIPVILGVAMGVYFVPLLYKKLPSDYVRTRLILEALAPSNQEKPDIIIFGSSVAMASVNGNVLMDSLGGVAYNLASTGQSFPESLLYYSKINRPTAVVVQFVGVDELINKPVLEKQKIRNFRLYGYTADQETNKLLAPIDVHYLHSSFLKIKVDSRALISNSINRVARGLLRKDLNLSDLNSELFYPTPYTVRLPKVKYDALIKEYNPKEKIDAINLDSSFVNLCKNADDFLFRRGVKFFLVINPTNPSLTNYTPALGRKIDLAMANCGFRHLNYLNFFSLLEDKDFIDNCHPAPAGANKITQELFLQLNIKN